MSISFDIATLTVEVTTSITDLPAFHAELRDWEDSEVGAIYPVTHRWRALDLGGAFLYQCDFINGWKLKFPNPGSYTIIGNLNATITPVAGAYVERKTSAAYTTTAIGEAGQRRQKLRRRCVPSLQPRLVASTCRCLPVQPLLTSSLLYEVHTQRSYSHRPACECTDRRLSRRNAVCLRLAW